MNYVINDGKLMVSSTGPSIFPTDQELTSIVIPEGVTTILKGTFANCTSLQEVVLPSTLSNILSQAFAGCSALSRIEGLRPDIFIDESVFKGCKGLADQDGFVVMNGVLHDYLGTQENITIPEQVHTIQTNAFNHNENIKSVVMGDHVKKIGLCAFSYSSLQKVHLPASIQTIPASCFQACSDLKDVHLSEGLVEIELDAFSGCNALEEIKLPSTLKKLHGFDNCTNLKRIQLPANLETISAYAFFQCKALTHLHIPAGTKLHYPYKFEKTTLLVMDKQYTSAEAAAKDNDLFGLTNTTLLSITAEDQSPLRMVYAPNQKMGFSGAKKAAFTWTNYDKALLNSTVKLPVAFQSLAMLCRLRWPVKLAEETKAVYLENVNKNIKKIAPYVNLYPEDGMIPLLEELGILTAKNKKTLLPLMGIGEAPAPKEAAPKEAAPSGEKTPAQLKKEWTMKKLSDGTLRLNSYKGTDTDVVVPAKIGNDAVTVIGEACFNCQEMFSRATADQLAVRRKIRTITISEGITTIEKHAFRMLPALESVILPSTLKVIDEKAFNYCEKLSSINMPEGITVGNQAFHGCKSLADENGFVILGDTLHGYFGTATDVVVPAHVRHLAAYAFSEAETVASVAIPQGVKELVSYTFSYCKNLKSVTLPPSVTNLEYQALPQSYSTKFIIRGYTGSYAEQYATGNSIYYTFESIGAMEEQEDESDFVIVDGVLTDYKGDDTVVTIPDGVTTIQCSQPSFFYPRGAFAGNETVQKVIIPEGVTKIGDCAFSKCPNLREIVFPSTLRDVSYVAFLSTPWYTEAEGPVYAGPVLVAYCGTTKEITMEVVEVRPGTRKIARKPNNSHITGVKKLILPDSLEEISDGGLDFRGGFEELVIPAGVKEVDKKAFSEPIHLKKCTGGLLQTKLPRPSHYAAFYTGEPDDTAWVTLYQTDAKWKKVVDEQLSNDPQGITSALELMVQLLSNADDPDKNPGTRAAAFAQKWCKNAGSQALQALYDVLKDKGHPAVKKLDADKDFTACRKAEKEDLTKLHPVEAKVVENLIVTPAFEKTLKHVSQGVHYAGSQEVCAPRVLAYVIHEYVKQHDPNSARLISEYRTACTSYAFAPLADETAAALDQTEMLAVMLDLAAKLGGEYWLPYARYADEKQTISLLSRMRDWDDWYTYAATGRKHIIIARSGLLLNDTRAAMLHFDKIGRLGQYAALRDMDEDTLRDTVLADLGFDQNREIRYDLGGNTAVIHLDQELKLSIYDEKAGKIVKSIPKKDAVPELYNKAKAAYASVKKNIGKILTNRKNHLFAEFLSGAERSAASWKQSYLDNPVLNSVARLVVWMQGDQTFVATANGGEDHQGQPYEITDEPIRVAHPIEMRKDISQWQEYFISRRLKQPFEQVWEPAYEPASITPDRFVGCSLSVYRLQHQEKHGITAWGLTSYSEEYGFDLVDCQMDQAPSAWRFVHGITDNAVFDLGKFTFEKYTRYVNHIVYMFDKWTVTERLLNDDVSIEASLPAFTGAQIREFLNLSTERGCINCSAMLLDYQNTHFGQIDPLMDFTLEL